MATLSFTTVDDYSVLVHSTADPTDEDWARYIDHCRSGFAKYKGFMVYTLGGGPNAKQRSVLHKLTQEFPQRPPVAVLNRSAIVRGIVTALNWFVGGYIRCFALHDYDGAFAYLHAARELRPKIRAAVEHLRKEVAT